MTSDFDLNRALDAAIENGDTFRADALRAELGIARASYLRQIDLVDRLENYYDFQCEGGPLRYCREWLELKKQISGLL